MLNTGAFPFLDFYGGGEKYVYYLSKYLAKEGIDVEILISSPKSKTAKLDAIKYTFIPPLVTIRYPLIATLLLNSYLFNTNAAIHLKRKKFDILHSYGSTSYQYLHFADRRPVIVQAWDNRPLKAKGLKRIVQFPIAERTKYCMTHAEAIAIEGEFQIDEITKLFGVDEEKIFVLPVGVDLNFIKKKLNGKRISRNELGLSDNDFVLISVNRFFAVKGINYLVDAFKIVKQNLNIAKLILIGAGPEEGRITKQIRHHKLTDSVLHLKNVSEDSLYEYYNLADIYVSPTLQKDFIMGILEAMACGLPVVSTGQEFIVQSGRNGYVVPPRSIHAMADAILKIYDDGAHKTMGTTSQKIVEEYDWEIIAKQAIKQYEHMSAY